MGVGGDISLILQDKDILFNMIFTKKNIILKSGKGSLIILKSGELILLITYDIY